MSVNEKESDRKFMIEVLGLYRTLTELWKIKSEDLSNREKKLLLMKCYWPNIKNISKVQLLKISRKSWTPFVQTFATNYVKSNATADLVPALTTSTSPRHGLWRPWCFWRTRRLLQCQEIPLPLPQTTQMMNQGHFRLVNSSFSLSF